MIGWHIFSTVCMILYPEQCYTKVMPIAYATQHQCLVVLADPWNHIRELPLIVEGSRSIKLGCKTQ